MPRFHTDFYIAFRCFRAHWAPTIPPVDPQEPYRALLRRCNSFEESEKIFADMLNAGVTPRRKVTSMLVAAYPRRSRKMMVERFARLGFLKNGSFVMYLMAILSKEGEAAVCQLLLTEMKALGLKLNVLLFTLLMRANFKAGDDVESVLSQMIAAGVQPDEIAYECLLNGYARLADIRGCESVFQRMTAAGISPNVFHFTSLLTAYSTAREGTLELCEGVFSLMDAAMVEPDVASFTTLLKAYIRFSDADTIFERCESIEQRMKAEFVTPDLHFFTLLIRAYSKSGRDVAKRCEAVMRRVEEAGFRPDASLYAALIRVYLALGNPRAAKEAMNRAHSQHGIPLTLFTNLLSTTSLREHYETHHPAQINSRHGCQPTAAARVSNLTPH